MRFTYKLIIALLLLNVGSNAAHACAWMYSSLLDGTIIRTDHEYDVPQAHFHKDSPEVNKALKKKLEQAKSTYRKTHNIKDYNDYGVMLMYTGEYKKAQKIFQENEAKKPGQYATAANLGTVNELLGENQQAYHWIKRAIEINPASHHHSEWIHLKILEAKIKAKGNPDYFHTHDILGLNFGNGKIPVKGTKRDLHNTKKEIYYQLAERMTFIPPKDPIVAQLLFDAGNIVAIIDDVKTALDVYAEARRYGYSGELIDQREKYFQQLQTKAEDKQHKDRSVPIIASIAILLLLLGIVLGLIIFIFKKVKSKKQLKKL